MCGRGSTQVLGRKISVFIVNGMDSSLDNLLTAGIILTKNSQYIERLIIYHNQSHQAKAGKNQQNLNIFRFYVCTYQVTKRQPFKEL